MRARAVPGLTAGTITVGGKQLPSSLPTTRTACRAASEGRRVAIRRDALRVPSDAVVSFTITTVPDRRIVFFDADDAWSTGCAGAVSERHRHPCTPKARSCALESGVGLSRPGPVGVNEMRVTPPA
jgi:hypothetical protein